VTFARYGSLANAWSYISKQMGDLDTANAEALCCQGALRPIWSLSGDIPTDGAAVGNWFSGSMGGWQCRAVRLVAKLGEKVQRRKLASYARLLSA
jgi:hypothetical protein